MNKREGHNEIFMQSPGSRNLASRNAGQAAVQSNYQCQWEALRHKILLQL